MKKSPFVSRGFTLIEVVIAFALLAMLVATLIRNQTNSLRTARQGADIILASQLARLKLIDCKFDLLKEGLGLTDYNEDGDFKDEGFPEFKWECHAPRLDIPQPDMSAMAEAKGADGAPKSSDPITQILSALYAPLVGALSNSVREMVTIVRWKSAGENQELKIATHIANVTQFAQAIAGLGFGGGKPPPPPPPPPKKEEQ